MFLNKVSIFFYNDLVFQVDHLTSQIEKIRSKVRVGDSGSTMFVDHSYILSKIKSDKEKIIEMFKPMND